MGKLTDQQIHAYTTLFRHFSARLSERYSLLISFEEYVSLCRSCPLRLAKPCYNKQGVHDSDMGFIRFRKVFVLVIKSTMGIKPLVTALPIHKKNLRQLEELLKQNTMSNKCFMVVSYPKDGSAPVEKLNPLHTAYADAFQVFNGHIAMASHQEFQQPKGEKPLRAALEDEIVELWVINRSDELITR